MGFMNGRVKRLSTRRSNAPLTQRWLAGLPVLRRDTMEGVYHALEGGYWGLVRFSGTEPLVRLYAEADSPERVQDVLGDMRGILRL